MWPEYWNFSFNISSSNKYSGLISFRVYWFDLLTFQGTFKSLFQHCDLKASILQLSTFFIVRLSHSYMTTVKTTALTKWTFVSKAMSLLFSMLSRFVIPFLSRSKCLLIPWLQSPSAGAQESKICHCFHFFPFYFPWCDGIGGFPGGAVVKNTPVNAGDTRDASSVPGLGWSPGVHHGNPL